MITALGVGLATGMLVAALSEPRWTVGGAPWVWGNAKDVDLRATLAAVLAGAATPLLAGRAARLVLTLVALAGALVAAIRWPATLPLAALTAVGAAGLAIAIERGFLRAAEPPSDDRSTVWPWLLGLIVALFLTAIGPMTIDVFHHGEVLVTALDLVRGGRPFETIAWPHGAHDSGLAALWIWLTGKVGSSPVMLAAATTAALAALPLYALTRRASGDRRAALLGAWLSVVLLLAVRPWPNPRVILGTLAFPVLAVVLATVRPPRAVAAGALAALGLVFRIDAGTYGIGALAVALSAGALLEPGPLGARLRLLAGRALGAASGGAAALLLLRLILGWPTSAWYAYLVGSLPRYHSMANGLPYPWPIGGELTLTAAMALGLPALAVTLGASAARAARGGVSPTRVALLAGVAVLAVGALRSGLGRSDLAHLLHFALPLGLLVALIAASAGLRWLAARRRLATALLAALAAIVALRLVTDTRRRPFTQLRQHLAANPPSGPCGETLFTPLEAVRDDVRALIDATCVTERQLREAGVRRLVIDHSAPWYYVRFDMPLPTPYYSFNRAALPDQQQRVVDDLRAYDADALLQVRRFRALERYDVPDGLRVPLIAAYLRERRGDAPLLATPIGQLALWNRPATPSASAAPPPVSGLRGVVTNAVYDPASRFLSAQGRVRDERGGGRLDVRIDGTVSDLQSWINDDGTFDLVTRLPAGLATPPPLTLVVEASDGRARRIRVPESVVTLLPPLRGAAVRDLAERTDAAAAAGRADRAAAIGE